MIIEKLNNKYSLLKMKLDIEKTKWNLEHFDSYKKRQNVLKNLKIYGNGVRVFAPYVLTFGIVTFGFHCVMGKQLLSQNYIKKNVKLNSYNYEEQIKNYNTNVYLFHYDKWSKDDNQKYYRKVECYSINNLVEYDILDICDKDIEDIIGSPIFTNFEISNNIDENDDYFEVISYDKNYKSYRIMKESFGDNILNVILYIVILEFAEAVPFFYYKTFSKFSFNKDEDDLNNRYNNLSKENLNKILKIKTENFKRLTK